MGRQAQSKRTCIFCGAEGSMTGEHIFADWLRELGYSGEGLREIYPSDATVPILQKGGPFSKKLKIVCLQCNGVWMSQMEKDVKPILIRMFNARPGAQLVLSEGEQLTLARWAFKTTVVLSYVDPRNKYEFPQIHRREFKLTDLPPMNVQIRVGGVPEPVLTTVRGDMLAETRFQPNMLSVSRPDGSVTEHSAYQAGLRLFNVVFVVIGYVADDRPVQIEANDGLAETTTLIWPQLSGPVQWEPRMGASIAGRVEDLSKISVLPHSPAGP